MHKLFYQIVKTKKLLRKKDPVETLWKELKQRSCKGTKQHPWGEAVL